jgi:Arc/MetJ-type ribon-helix-helix transcriptional regulator
VTFSDVIHIYSNKIYTMRKDIMISLRITPQQYVTLLETLVKEKKSKSELIRAALTESIQKLDSHNCRKSSITSWVDRKSST